MNLGAIQKKYEALLRNAETEHSLIIATLPSRMNGNAEVVELAITEFNGNVLYHSRFNPMGKIDSNVESYYRLTKSKLSGEPSLLEEWDKIESILRSCTVVAFDGGGVRNLLKNSLRYSGVPISEAKLRLEKLEWVSMAGDYGKVTHQLGLEAVLHNPSASLHHAAHFEGIGSFEAGDTVEDCWLTLELIKRLGK